MKPGKDDWGSDAQAGADLLSIPPNASREDLAALQSLAQEVLDSDPDREDAKAVLAQLEKLLAPKTDTETPAEQPQVQQPSIASEPEFPNDILKALALMNEAKGVYDRMPNRKDGSPTPQKVTFGKQLAKLKHHFHSLQQGPVKTAQIDAKSNGQERGLQRASILNYKLRTLSSQYPEVKQLIAERDALLKENAALKEAAKRKK